MQETTRFQARVPTREWKANIPRLVVAGFAVAPDGRFPILFRSDKVRSAKNCWSLPSGLHEVGVMLEEQFCNELSEELGLVADPTSVIQLGAYENIVTGNVTEDPWHWTIVMMAIKVDPIFKIRNAEPDKHSEVRLITLKELSQIAPWAPMLRPWMKENHMRIFDAINSLI